MLDEAELAWLDDQMRGDVDHVLVGTSLPFLIAPALHHIEALDEELAEGPVPGGRPVRREAPQRRRTSSTGRRSRTPSATMSRMTVEVATGRRGRHAAGR